MMDLRPKARVVQGVVSHCVWDFRYVILRLHLEVHYSLAEHFQLHVFVSYAWQYVKSIRCGPTLGWGEVL